MILAGVGFILISLSYNLTLGAGAVLLAFGIDSIMASSFNDPSISQFTSVGYLFVGIGILLISVNIYSFLKRKSEKEKKYYFFPRF
jgi:multisubunit Na+/H+ antiporter MnhB subunit